MLLTDRKLYRNVVFVGLFLFIQVIVRAYFSFVVNPTREVVEGVMASSTFNNNDLAVDFYIVPAIFYLIVSLIFFIVYRSARSDNNILQSSAMVFMVYGVAKILAFIPIVGMTLAAVLFLLKSLGILFAELFPYIILNTSMFNGNFVLGSLLFLWMVIGLLKMYLIKKETSGFQNP